MLERFEKKIYSQNGEDGVLEEIFKRIGTTNKFFVEFGVEDGTECNTRLLQQKGWQGLLMDNENNNDNIKKETVTAENINSLFAKYKVPKKFDLLSIDLDGNDYWIWKALTGYEPRVILIEYNAHISPKLSKTIAYDPHFKWQKDDYFGASLKALAELGLTKGYELIYCDSKGINAFFVQSAVSGNFKTHTIEEIYRPPLYGSEKKGHPKSHKEMQDPTLSAY